MSRKKLVFVVLVFIALFPTMAFASDFEIENFNIQVNSGSTIFIGEIINNSNTSYTVAFFDLAIFNTNNQLLDVIQLMISNLPSKGRKTFKETVLKTYPEKIKYRLEFSTGIPNFS